MLVINKKGDWEGGKSFFTLLIGLIMGAFGIIPLLKNLNVIAFDLPFTLTGIVLSILLTIGGIWLFISGCMEIAGTSTEAIGYISLIIALLVIFVGAVPLLNTLGLISFTMPSILLAMPSNILLTLAGIFLILDSFLF